MSSGASLFCCHSIRRAKSWPTLASNGVIVRPTAVTTVQNAAVSGEMSRAVSALASTISVVSDGLAIRTPVSVATPVETPPARSNSVVTSALIKITPTTAPITCVHSAAIRLRSRLIPTLIRNTPSANPLNGAVVTSTSARYLVSAISSPATSAPTMGESPTAVVARLARMTVNRLTDRNSSGLLVRAACANSGGNSHRPRISIAATVATPIAMTLANSANPPVAADGAIALNKKMIGTSAKSSNNSIASASFPTGLVVPAIGKTSAVDDSVSARPSPIAAAAVSPNNIRASAMSPPAPISSTAPKPNNGRRIAHNRLNDNSSPIENRRRMIPSSAKGAIEEGSVIVT